MLRTTEAQIPQGRRARIAQATFPVCLSFLVRTSMEEAQRVCSLLNLMMLSPAVWRLVLKRQAELSPCVKAGIQRHCVIAQVTGGREMGWVGTVLLMIEIHWDPLGNHLEFYMKILIKKKIFSQDIWSWGGGDNGRLLEVPFWAISLQLLSTCESLYFGDTL